MANLMLNEGSLSGLEVLDWQPSINLSISEPISERQWRVIREKDLLVYFAITNRCNMHCKVCYMLDKDGSFPFDDMSLEDIKRFLQKVGKNKKIQLFGGEPTVRDDIFEIIRMIKKSGNIPMLFTNGLKLADLNYVKMLSESGIKIVSMSLDGLDESTTVTLRGDKEHLYSKFKAIANLLAIKTIKVWLSATIYHGSEWEISNLIKFAISKKEVIKGIILIGYTPWGRYDISSSSQVHVVDLIKGLSEATNGQLDTEYFLEFSRLKRNINQILNKLKGSDFMSYISVLTKIENRNLSPVIPVKELREINDCLDQAKYLSLLKYACRHRRWADVIVGFIKNRIFNITSPAYENCGQDILSICVATPIRPLINSKDMDRLCIGLSRGDFVPLRQG